MPGWASPFVPAFVEYAPQDLTGQSSIYCPLTVLGAEQDADTQNYVKLSPWKIADHLEA
jgi:hypothetical protein